MSTAKFDTLSNLAGTQTVPVATVAQGSAKAWVNFNGTGTVAIRAAFNVSSITDNGTGDYTVNFITALPDRNYSLVGTCGTPAVRVAVVSNRTIDPAAGSCRIGTYDGGVVQDVSEVNVAIFR